MKHKVKYVLKRILSHWSSWLYLLFILSLLFSNKFVIGSPANPSERDFYVMGGLWSGWSSSILSINAPVSPEMTRERIITLIEQRAEKWGVNSQIMLRLARCESEYRQFEENGSVLRGREVSSDIGLFQINIDPNITDWANVAKMTGYDPFTLEGNIELAMLIAHDYGYRHWVCYR